MNNTLEKLKAVREALIAADERLREKHYFCGKWMTDAKATLDALIAEQEKGNWPAATHPSNTDGTALLESQLKRMHERFAELSARQHTREPDVEAGAREVKKLIEERYPVLYICKDDAKDAAQACIAAAFSPLAGQ